ncbi:MAG TPA: hypothetical protein VD833_12095 [Vicinamibacterales bacterium]|nr:hypothetical protein [Vicinamibacterales bacterium]
MVRAIHNPSLRLRGLAALLACAFGLSCSSSPTSPGDSPADATIVIGAAGVVPTEVRINSFSRVMFTNNDTRPHAIASDPVTLHTDCPAVNQVGTLEPGQSRTTGTLHLKRTCGFHDHLNQDDARLRGRIVVD